MKLHGALRRLDPVDEEGVVNEWEWQLLEDKTPLDSVFVSGVALRPGRHRPPAPRSVATSSTSRYPARPRLVESIEQDYEGKPLSSP